MSTVRRLGAYSIEQIRPDVFAIDDDQMESMYLIRGKDKALSIQSPLCQWCVRSGMGQWSWL